MKKCNKLTHIQQELLMAELVKPRCEREQISTMRSISPGHTEGTQRLPTCPSLELLERAAQGCVRDSSSFGFLMQRAHQTVPGLLVSGLLALYNRQQPRGDCFNGSWIGDGTKGSCKGELGRDKQTELFDEGALWEHSACNEHQDLLGRLDQATVATGRLQRNKNTNSAVCLRSSSLQLCCRLLHSFFGSILSDQTLF